MQFNSILFPGPAMSIIANYKNIIYIPRGRLPEPIETTVNENIEQKLGEMGESNSTMQRGSVVRNTPRSGGGLFSCFSTGQNSRPSQMSQISKREQQQQLASSQPPPRMMQSAAAATQQNQGCEEETKEPVRPKPAIAITEKAKARQVHVNASQHIPCFYLQNTSSSKLLIYFHGNAECLTLAEQQMRSISNYCNVSVLGMEYPGYGLYQDNGNASEEKIKEDAEYIYKFCLHDMGIQEKDILVFGRSMGSGPASFLAGQYNPGALILMSAYTSIKRVAGDQVGFLRVFVAERFENIVEVTRATCPTFILHGRQDEVIPFHHGQALANAAVGQPLTFIDRPQMTHNDFNMNRDLLRPLQEFLQTANIDTSNMNGQEVPQFKTTDLNQQN